MSQQSLGFAQRDVLTQTTLVREEEKFSDFVFGNEIHYLAFLNHNITMIQWDYSKQCVIPPGQVNNIFVAAFTTACARLKMYDYLERLQERVLYTDSLIYTVKEGESPLELGDYLGQLTDELNGDNIQEFASARPKGYAYQSHRDKRRVPLEKSLIL